MAATPFSGLQMGYFDVRVANSFSGRKRFKKMFIACTLFTIKYTSNRYVPNDYLLFINVDSE